VAVRYATALAVAAAITFGLFYMMQSMIARGSIGYESEKRVVLDFVRYKRDEQLQTKKRQKPRKVERKEPPPPQMPVQKMAQAPNKQALRVDAPPFRPQLAFAGGPHLGSAPSDSYAVPLVRVDPRYPRRAQSRAVEGWVHLRFTVTPEGTTRDIVILDADPPNYFEKSAINAVKKYKYKPRFENGVPVEQEGVELVLSFELAD
jgi:protein TonB